MHEIAALVGQKIRQIRTYKKMSQEDLAFRAGLHPAQVGHIERGEQAATLETLGRLAAGLDVSLSQLVDIDSVYTERGEDEQLQREYWSAIGRLGPAEQRELLGVVKLLVRWAEGRGRRGR